MLKMLQEHDARQLIDEVDQVVCKDAFFVHVLVFRETSTAIC